MLLIIAAFLVWEAVVFEVIAQPPPGTLDTSFDPQTPLTLTRAIAVDNQARVLSVGNLLSGGATIVRQMRAR